MTSLAIGRPRRRRRFDLNQHRGLIMGVVVFCIVFGGLNLVLAKPFRPAQLIAAVEQVLGELSAGGRKESGRNRPRAAKDRS